MTSSVSTRTSRSRRLADERRRGRRCGVAAPASRGLRRRSVRAPAAGPACRRAGDVAGRRRRLRHRLDEQRLLERRAPGTTGRSRGERVFPFVSCHSADVRTRAPDRGRRRTSGWQRARRRAASQVPRTTPWRHDRLRGVVGAGRQKPARAGKIRRDKQLYSRESAPSDKRTATGRLTGHRCDEGAFEDDAVIGFKGGQAGVEQFALRHDDDVEPGAILLRRKISRISRLALFLWTAPPSFLVAAIPRRPTRSSLGSMKAC